MPKIVDVGERRSAFVAASWEVIAAEGLNGATLKRVAAAAGCTTGALTHYFDDRASLLIDALRAAHYEAGARMLRVAQEAGGAEERLRQVLLEALPIDELRLREWRVWIAFWGATTGDATLLAENARRYEEWTAFVEQLLEPLTASAEDARWQAERLVALVDGLGLRVALIADPAERAQAQARCGMQVDAVMAQLKGAST